MSIVTSPTTLTPASSSSQISNPNNTISQNGFLQLLVAQLQNQDPMNPLSTDQFITENTMFSQLQQLVNMNQTLSTLSNQSQTNAYAASLLGKNILTNTASININGASITPLAYTLSQPAADVKATIINSSGNSVATVDLGQQSSGTNTFQFNGKDANGNYISNGNYTVAFTATDSNGNIIPVNQSAGTVTSISFGSNGAILNTNLGNSININYVTGVSS